jgi:hypothetical protein
MNPAMPATSPAPTSGCVVQCRSHHWLAEELEPAEHPQGDPVHPQGDTVHPQGDPVHLQGDTVHLQGDPVVRLACLDDDANGQRLELFWQREVDALVLGETSWDTVGQRGFDQPQLFGSYLNTLRWTGSTSPRCAGSGAGASTRGRPTPVASSENLDQLLLDLGGIKEERRQLEDNRKYWEERLQTIDSDLEREPERIRRTFALQTHRVEPAGAIYLWPQGAVPQEVR